MAGGGAGTLLSITVSHNDIEDCAATTARPVETRGIDFSGTNSFSTLVIASNKVASGDLGVAPKVGIATAGTLPRLGAHQKSGSAG